jgi:hypothetical protein
MLSKSDWPFETNHLVQLSQMESVNMPKQIVATVIQLPAGNAGGPFQVNEGALVEFSTTSAEYPNFEIQFVGHSPANAGNDLSGSIDDPVGFVASAKDVNKKFAYFIEHIKEDGTSVTTGPIPFSVRGCPGCESAVAYVLPSDQAVNQAVANQSGADQNNDGQ